MLKVLFICTHNRCRSILCEALSNDLGRGRLIARSAGSHPAEAVHPLTLEHLALQGVLTENLVSQSWDDFVDFNPDLIITVCDDAAGEVCPAYFSSGVKVHWGLKDPSREEGEHESIEVAFRETISEIRSRVKSLLEIEADSLRGDALQHAVVTLGATSS
jgi:arsenate reductase